jgi:hypothetical protein
VKRRVITGAACGLPILLLAVFAVATRGRDHVAPYFAARMMPGAPIPGQLVSLTAAQGLNAPVGLPLLPASSLPDPCTTGTTSVSLLALWSSSSTIPLAQRQFGMNYSNGIWVSVSPLSGYNAAS